jgi:16S rRNA (adenine1518-N6/adenine1519-N6)-dimethyltransferase
MAHFRPRKSLGQNFLSDNYYIEQIVDALKIGPDDTFLEIGPGKGVITSWLLERAAQVVAVELDSRLYEVLRDRFGDRENLQLTQQDFLKFNFAEVAGEEVRVMGNIPYHITSAIMFRLFEEAADPAGPRVRDLTILMQREVAQRITAKPGTKAYGVLSVFSRLHSTPEIILQVPSGAFTPKPKVDSSVMQFRFPREPQNKISDMKLFRKIVKASFNQRRKTLRNSLRSIPEFAEQLDKIDFDLSLRPEALPLEEFIRLYHEFQEAGNE